MIDEYFLKVNRSVHIQVIHQMDWLHLWNFITIQVIRWAFSAGRVLLNTGHLKGQNVYQTVIGLDQFPNVVTTKKFNLFNFYLMRYISCVEIKAIFS